jgi:tetratricopeptide (TPR) repeat protein
MLSRGGLLYGGALLIAALAMALFPVSDHLGFEFAAGLALVAGVFGGATGMSAAARERARKEGDSANGAAAAAAAAMANALWLAVPVGVILLNGLRRPACDNVGGAALTAAIALPSALLSGALGTLCGAIGRRRWIAVALYALVLLASLARSLWPVWAGPQAFAYDHLLGWFPGPLYDEVVQVEWPLVRFRLLTLAWTAAVVEAAGLVLRRGARPPLWRRLLVLGVWLAVLAAGFVRREAWGLESSAELIEEKLGGRTESAHFVIHYPREKSEADARLVARDHEFRFAQVAKFLGVAPEGKIQSYVHRSAAEKRALTGAADVSFAKPWRKEIQLVDAPFPHPVLQHELVHVLAGEIAPGPFHVPARAWLWVNMGLVEGLAVAGAPPNDDLTLHQWARALRDLQLAPDLASLLGPAGFFAQAPERAYTFAGSFVRWLADTRGADAVRKMYERGEVGLWRADSGAPEDTSLAQLAAGYEKFLDGVELGPEARTVAERRFRRPAIFQRTCAREIQRMSFEADAALGRGDAETAESLRRRCAELEPDDPQQILALARVLRKRDRVQDARDAAQRALEHAKAGPSLKASALMQLGDWAWERGDTEEAKKHFASVLDLRPGTATERSARVRLEAIEDPLATEKVRPLLVGAPGSGGAGAGDLHLLSLRELIIERPAAATWWYLLGRQLFNRGEMERALGYLDEASRLGLLQPSLEVECTRLQISARYRAGRCADVPEAAARIRLAGAPADAEWAADWEERCRFEAPH